MAYQAGDRITHPTFGPGEINLDREKTVIIRFDHGIEECEPATLSTLSGLTQAIATQTHHPPLAVILRGLAATIDSLNDRWSVFSRSRVKLLPHQLWVCRKVLERWPFRWLIADDVGLGKTIEAGLILWPLISRHVVKRVLILAPASLTEQWVLRLKQMFDLRFTLYNTESDKPKLGFWETHHQVVASLQTLRDDRQGRHERLLNSPHWDLVIVDEAHHLNADEASGTTLSFRLVQKLQEHQKIKSMLFFTGTPHRGKDYGFLSLLKLLNPHDFSDPKQSLEGYLPKLRDIMIRNNKQNVTNLRGELLFNGIKARVVTYHYSPQEANFYDTLTQFILTGRAYASSLDSFQGRAVNLVLSALQKLAASSVAAVRSALEKRLNKMRSRQNDLQELKALHQQIKKILKDTEEADCYLEQDIADLDHQIAELSALVLMENEQQYLVELITLAQAITDETRIQRILELLEQDCLDRSILFFTEYKVTQSLLMTALIHRYGENSVTFINGDHQANEVNGKTIRCRRDRAVELFNTGQARFLVSTEAAGEGVDLQQNCYTLIHVDIPWNPMRLHQRVGRLYRYGQTHPVEVITLRNPDTIEATIWERLEEKLHRIQLALGGVMDEQEDLLPMVLGMTSSSIWREIFSEAPTVPQDTLKSWFDTKTRRFGGQEALTTVRNLIGHCATFDYQEIASQLLDIDLPALKPFFKGMLIYNHRQVKDTETGLAFRTPEAWSRIGIQSHYEGLVFERDFQAPDANRRIIGVGSPLLEQALEQARCLEDSVAILPKSLIKYPIVLLTVTDRVTDRSGSIRAVLLAVEFAEIMQLKQDYEIIKWLNTLATPALKYRELINDTKLSFVMTQDWLNQAETMVFNHQSQLDLSFRVPEPKSLVLLCPEDWEALDC